MSAEMQTNNTSAKRPMEPADLCRFRSVAEVRLHPDREHVMFAVTWPDADSDRNRSVLYTTTVDGRNLRQLTHGHRDSGAVFSADGTRLAFIRTAPEEPARVMVLDWPVGEITEVVELEDGASEVGWLNGDRLLVLGPKRPDSQIGVEDKELARRPRILTSNDYRFNGRGYINDRPRQLLVVPVPTDDRPSNHTIDELGMPGVDHGAFAVSPDGRTVAATAATDDDADLTGTNHIWLYHVDGSETPIRLTEPGSSWASLTWHPDQTLVAFGALDTSTVGFHRPYLVGSPSDGAVPQVTEVPDQDQNAVPAMWSGGGAVPVDGGLLVPGVRNGRIAVDRYNLDPTATPYRTVVRDEADQVHSMDCSPDGTVMVAAITSATRPAELWRIDGEPKRLTTFNDQLLAELDLAEVEEVTVTSTEGAEVHAFVVRPPGSAPAPDAEGKRPGLVYIHGGPMFQYGLYFFDEFQMAAACGYVVIGGNPRGSDGYGEGWAQAITGDLGNRDWDDIKAITDHLAELPEVDDNRIGIGGGSYGGFMTGWALSHSDRYRAGLVERAVTSWNTMFGTSDIGAWFSEKTVGATIEGDVDRVTRQSPLHYADQITSPTLIIHSEEDWRCPIEQAEQLFVAIRRNGGSATFVRFPGENHELSRSGIPSHRIERFEIVHEFYARHLGGGDLGSNHL